MTDTTTITICVCTFRRPHLAETLASLARLRLPGGAAVDVVVADNDREPSAKPVVDAARAGLPFELTYVHAPGANISIARNACLDAARGRFVAFIDDDEIASPDWLAALLAKARETKATAVLGPVHALYENDAPRWMREGDFHSTFPVWVKGEIVTGYTCNVLINRAAPDVDALRFDLALGRSGGEDTAFFDRLHKGGGRIAYAESALLEEGVPPGRARFSWLAKRRFRMGQTHGLLLREAGRGRPAEIAVASGKALACVAMSVANLGSPVELRRNLLRGLLHVGVVGSLLGMQSLVQYGETKERPHAA
ncbi:glycosyltransferase [Aureimonas mangrovi]|uniref:glycosyltransferase n=1 Tax=Aureimonas mangrovi TaxID=2758041 RepID=UPI00163DCFC8|nr:glycosyltransferase family A protein [Aureimonas mangrovi]